MELQEIKDIATIAKPFVDPIISALITPKLERLKAWLKKDHINEQAIDYAFENKFREYLYRTFRNCSNLNVLVFPNQQINIKDIYQPLTIHSDRENKNFKIDVFKESYIKTYKNILISDNAGMGKSTLMKWIAISLIEQSLTIPILIELKRINAKHTLLDEIFNQINPIDKSFDKDLILRFLELGSFTILLDGFDEVEFDERSQVIDDIKNLTSKADKNWFILTSRPDPELTAFGNFQIFNIRPLTKKESFELIDKYDGVNNNRLSVKLKEDIELKFSQVEEFLTNSFLLSLLYKTYTYNKDIPSKKSTFYDEVYSALYKHHDLSKDGFKRNKKSGLDIHDFRLVIRILAFNTAKRGKVEYTELELIEHLKETKASLSGIEFKELSFIEDLEFNVPLFMRDGRNLKWAHKSVQDYFCAEFISSHADKKELVQRIYLSQRSNYLQILDFISEIEPQVFRETIVLPLLKKFLHYCNNSYKACVVPKAHIKRRQSLTFGILFGMEAANSGHEVPERWMKMFGEEDRKFGDFKLNSISFSSDETGPVIEMFAISYDQEIINILGNRGENYAKKISSKEKRKKMKFRLPKNGVILLDDTPECIFNFKHIFDEATDRIVSSGIMVYILDYEKSAKEIDLIESQVKAINEKNIFEGI